MQKGAAEWPCTIHQSERHSQKLFKHHHHHDHSAISDDGALEILVLLNDEEVVEKGSPHYYQSF